MKMIRKPLFTAIILLAIISVIYFMSTSSHALGDAAPITLQKNSAQVDNILGEVKSEVLGVKKGRGRVSLDEQQQLKQEKGQAKEGSKIGDQAIGADLGGDLAGSITETPFMPKMANETLKAQLGTASWKLFHTILARYPDTPTKQEQTTLALYIQLFGQVYPCGDCARHFQHLLAKYPPQTASRKSAALWGCDIHNKVNEKLKKPEYDCTTILEDYDCGCGSDEKLTDYTLGNESMDHLRDIKVTEKSEGLQMG
jgi:FAD-linked sulfhydryl oxidase